MHPLDLDHVAIAVPSIADALPVFQSLTCAESSAPEHLEDQGVAVAFIEAGATRIELVQPTRPDSPVARFLKRRGSGLHHLAFAVPDIDAALHRLAAAGFRPIDTEPRTGAHGSRVAFLHPATSSGVLVELVQR